MKPFLSWFKISLAGLLTAGIVLASATTFTHQPTAFKSRSDLVSQIKVVDPKVLLCDFRHLVTPFLPHPSMGSFRSVKNSFVFIALQNGRIDPRLA